MTRWIYFATAILATALLAPPLVASELSIVTEDFPPYSYQDENGEVTGLSTEVVEAVLERVGLEAPITVLPWPRAFSSAREGANILLFSVARNSEREHMFKWVGTISPYNVYIYKMRMRPDIKIGSIAEIDHYKVGGSVNKDIKMEYLMSHGIKNIFHIRNDELNIRKLVSGRVDVIPYDQLGLTCKANQLRINGTTIEDFEKAYFLEEISSDLYMAFGAKTSDQLVEKFRRGLESIKQDGTFQKIWDRWIHPNTCM